MTASRGVMRPFLPQETQFTSFLTQISWKYQHTHFKIKISWLPDSDQYDQWSSQVYHHDRSSPLFVFTVRFFTGWNCTKNLLERLLSCLVIITIMIMMLKMAKTHHNRHLHQMMIGFCRGLNHHFYHRSFSKWSTWFSDWCNSISSTSLVG